METINSNAKLREALSDACYAMFNFLKTQYGGYEEMAKALDKAKAALAAPPRNCDKIHDIHEMSIAESPLDMPLVCAPREELLRFIYWLFAEAKGGAE